MEQGHHNDILIVGAGPAGLTLALLLLKCGALKVTVIDKRPIRTMMGHASGIQPRTLEILQTVGLLHDFSIDSAGFQETAFYSASGNEDLKRTSIAHEVTNETPFKQVLLQNQGRAEEILHAAINKRGLHVRRPAELLHYEYDETSERPICAFVKDVNRGQVDKIYCKYLIGADGASSRTRDLAGMELSVHQTSDTWIVADCIVDTDLPDFRRRCAIRTSRGSIMLIPMPHNTVRVYVLLADEQDVADLEASKFDGPRDRLKQNKGHHTLLDILQRRINRILHPFTMRIKDVEWISKYLIAQRVIENFSDGKNVLFVGDACHSHSPKAAQGMNTGISDAVNLAWKLALILRGRADPKILETYNTERNHIAHQLIEFDIKFSGLFGDTSQSNPDEFRDMWKSAQGFTSGLDQLYPANALVKEDSSEASILKDAITPLTPGKRILPMNLVRHIDGLHISSLDTMPFNGQMYLVVFAGDILHEPRKSEFAAFYNAVTSHYSPLTTYNGCPPQDLENKFEKGWTLQDTIHNSEYDPNSKRLLNLYVVHTSDILEIELRPDFETWKYGFFSDSEDVEHRRHGIDPNAGMQATLVRCDGIISFVRAADAKLLEYLHTFLGDAGVKQV